MHYIDSPVMVDISHWGIYKKSPTKQTLIFFNPSLSPKIFQSFSPDFPRFPQISPDFPLKKPIIFFVVAQWLVIQLLQNLRHHFDAGHLHLGLWNLPTRGSTEAPSGWIKASGKAIEKSRKKWLKQRLKYMGYN